MNMFYCFLTFRNVYQTAKIALDNLLEGFLLFLLLKCVKDFVIYFVAVLKWFVCLGVFTAISLKLEMQNFHSLFPPIIQKYLFLYNF